MKLLTKKDVMEITGYKDTKAYDIIKELNNELKEQGYHIWRAKVPEKYFKERYYL